MFRGIAVALLLAGAIAPAEAQQQSPAQPPAAPGQVTCTASRPQVCAQNYLPVCATKSDGTRQTYGNACSACADANVVSHVPGPCR